MGFRTVVINTRCKLELKLNYLVCRGDETKRIFIDEISSLIIHSTAVALTTALISELVKKNVKVIFCDEKHNPLAELMPYYGSYNNSLKIEQQILWNDYAKQKVWTNIIKQKIINQAKVLQYYNHNEEAIKLLEYANQVELNDVTNREGHSAKVYFSALFGKSWNRDCGDFYCKALNYGYTILLSTFNREITQMGYLTQLGIWHKNQFNKFNLSCDLMETFRPFIDKLVVSMPKDCANFKPILLDVFNKQVMIDKKNMYFENAIEEYVRSVIHAIESGDEKLTKIMRCRFMRMMVFFDLPVICTCDKQNYRQFRKFLVDNGFVMMQNSVYSKIVLNDSNLKSIERMLKSNLPPKGNVQLLCVTEKQYASIEFLVGKNISDVEQSEKRVVEI